MKNLQTFEEFLNESFRSNYNTDSKDLKGLIKAIETLPDTIKSIKIPIEIKVSGARTITFEPTKNPNWKNDAIAQINNTLKSSRGIDKFVLKSYFGDNTKGDKDPYLVDFESKQSRDFADRMNKGEYGSLD